MSYVHFAVLWTGMNHSLELAGIASGKLSQSVTKRLVTKCAWYASVQPSFNHPPKASFFVCTEKSFSSAQTSLSRFVFIVDPKKKHFPESSFNMASSNGLHQVCDCFCNLISGCFVAWLSLWSTWSRKLSRIMQHTHLTWNQLVEYSNHAKLRSSRKFPRTQPTQSTTRITTRHARDLQL